jgi:hypothetical protein
MLNRGKDVGTLQNLSLLIFFGKVYAISKELHIYAAALNPNVQLLTRILNLFSWKPYAICSVGFLLRLTAITLHAIWRLDVSRGAGVFVENSSLAACA